MNLLKLQPREALNKAFLKINPLRNDIENFKTHLQNLLDKINEAESEEFHKHLISDFLKHTFYSTNYSTNHFINTKGHNDLVIHNGKDAKTSVGVILEFKKPNNKAEMLKTDNINTKAFQELVLYFLRERILEKNLEVKYLIATNIYEWFIFDAEIFEKLFVENKSFLKQFTDFEEGRLTSKKTEFFYKEIAQPAISEITDKITFTHFDIREYQQYLQPGKHPNEHKLISLFKLFYPEHLLKLPFTNDSNTLDKGFYSELLHIIGLVETKEGGKKLIQRKKEHDRNMGSLIENAIFQIDNLEKISRLEKPEQFGETYQEQLFNLGLELAITWMNRILFLKLLEAQLMRYHKNDLSWGFLNLQKVTNYNDLNSLFFSVLARKPQERSKNLQQKLQEGFSHVPYLNSSLFEPTELEQETIFISNLRNEKLPIFTGTILKDNNGKKLSGEINTLEYLFEFLNAYNFSSDTGEEIQEENKRLINAAVLGLIFEKINGYKDGSFFTPGFISMYMCRETIRRAVMQKFNDVQGWNCESIDDLYDKIEDKKAANDIINSLKICDPAVGSGHFLVSALNEIIAIKSELKILLDRQGKRLKEYTIEVANDELVVTDEDGLLFEYNPKNQESQRVQETLFHEKQTIIENCLFGVDINPNSVKICRLRLWIELLKNAYYKTSPLTPLLGGEGNIEELETLPNIDINIKCGNSLISRFALDADLRVALSKQKYSIEDYKNAVRTYRNAENKEQKREMERLINDIKGSFKTTLGLNDPHKTKLRKLEGEVENLENQIFLIPETKAEKTKREKKIAKLNNEINKLKVEIEDIEGGKIYENALEWRFEFPEVLNDEGVFIGFDVVIGNPPYAVLEKERNTTLEPYQLILEYAKSTHRYDKIEGGKLNLYRLFIYLSYQISKCKNEISLIVPLTIVADNSLFSTRKFLLDSCFRLKLLCFPQKDIVSKRVFEDAKQSTLILMASINKKLKPNETNILVYTYPSNSFNDNYKFFATTALEISKFDPQSLCIPLVSENEWKIINKIHQFKPIKDESNILVHRGEINQTIFRNYITSSQSHKKLVKGVEIGRYKINTVFSQGVREYFNEDAFLASKKSNDLCSIKRIATQRITGVDEKLRLVATIVDEYSYFADSTNSIHIQTDDVYSLEYILALINSRLFQWRFQKTSSNNNVSTTEIEALPFTYSENLESKITIIVSEILKAKKSDPNADTTALEAEIDQMVYQLYNLTPEEVKIIESL